MNIQSSLKPAQPVINLPALVDPVADLKPHPDVVGGDSWFVVANLKAGDHEFGFLVHFMAIKGMDGNSTVAITDVTDGRYFSEDAKGGDASSTADGLAIHTPNITWSATGHEMKIHATLKDQAVVDLAFKIEGPALLYSSTGYFPVFGPSSLNWQYAFPAMATTGTLTVDGEVYPVTGKSWFDRQWGPLPNKELLAGKVRWSWMAIRLSTGDCVGVWDTVGEQEHAWATVLHPDGSHTIADIIPLARDTSGEWTSASTKERYPTQWTVIIPALQARLEVSATSEGQESIGYMPRQESVIHVTGSWRGQNVTGEGYAEMVQKTMQD